MTNSKMDLAQLAERIAATSAVAETHDTDASKTEASLSPSSNEPLEHDSATSKTTSKIEGEGSLTMRCQWDGSGDPLLACTHEYKTSSGMSKYCPCLHYKHCALPGCKELVLADAHRITCCSAHKNALAALNHEHQETCQWPGCGKTFIVKSPGTKYCDGPHYSHCANPGCPLPDGKFATTSKNPKRIPMYCSRSCRDEAMAGKRVVRVCELPGCDNPTSSKTSRTCCREHAVALRKLTQSKMLQDESRMVECAFPGCHNKFVPLRKNEVHCHEQHYAVCEVCGKKTAVKHVNLKRPPRACCPSHATMLGHTPESKAKRVANSMARWGTKSPLQASEIKAKIKKTLDEHPERDHRIGSANFREQIRSEYGVDNVSSLDEIKARKRATSMAHYGVENPFQSKVVQEKVKATNRRIYGVDTVLVQPEVQERARAATREKYGVDYPMQSPVVRQKIQAVIMSKWGAKTPFESPKFMAKFHSDSMDRHGTFWPSQSEEVKGKILRTLHEKYGEDVDNVFQLDEVKQKSRETLLEKTGYAYPLQDPETKARAKATLLDTIYRKANDTSVKTHRPYVSKLNRKFAADVLEAIPGATVEYEARVPGTGYRVDMRFSSADGSRSVFVDVNPTVSHNSRLSYWCLVSGCKPNRDGSPHKHAPAPGKSYAYDRAAAMRAAYPDVDYVQVWDWDDPDEIMSLLKSELEPAHATGDGSGAGDDGSWGWTAIKLDSTELDSAGVTGDDDADVVDNDDAKNREITVCLSDHETTGSATGGLASSQTRAGDAGKVVQYVAVCNASDGGAAGTQNDDADSTQRDVLAAADEPVTARGDAASMQKDGPQEANDPMERDDSIAAVFLDLGGGCWRLCVPPVMGGSGGGALPGLKAIVDGFVERHDPSKIIVDLDYDRVTVDRPWPAALGFEELEDSGPMFTWADVRGETVDDLDCITLRDVEAGLMEDPSDSVEAAEDGWFPVWTAGYRRFELAR